MSSSRFLIFTCMMVCVRSHGFLKDPLNRASLWRYGYHSPPDYDDDGLNCGGFSRQHIKNGGKCGICGDAYDEPRPRPHELGGRYGKGIIVANYKQGQTITTNIYLTTAHLGYWELRISPDPYCQEQKCFDNGYLLELEDGGTKYAVRRGSGSYEVRYRLPAGLTCKHCVLQWMYTAGNNGGGCPNGINGAGCEPQEQFYSCSDISIGNRVFDLYEESEEMMIFS